MRNRGFTIFELMVVISIIVLLAGILIPTLSGARNKARKTQTEALLSNLVSDIEGYYTQFSAYPGPMPSANTTGASGNKISGSQNLLLGLSYGMTTTPAAPNVQIPGAVDPATNAPMFVNPTAPSGPINLGNINPAGQAEQLSAFFSPTSKQLSANVTGNPMQWNPGGAQGSAGSNSFRFPVIVDPYPDGLPILYYRRTPGVETPVVAANTSAGAAAYYTDENMEYTTATTLTATSGMVLNETLATFNLSTLVQNSGAATARGSFVLVSPGLDRYYGTWKGKNDDIVQVGGH